LRIENKKKGDNVMTPLPPRRQDSMRSLRYNTQVISIVSTFVRGVKRLRIENKKRASEPSKNSLALQSLRNSMKVISIISLLLGFVTSFFMRGRYDTEPRACQFS